MIFARTKQAQGFLGQEFEQRRAKKVYVARVAGVVEPDRGRIDLPIGADWEFRPRQKVDHGNGRSAVTDWEVVARSEGETRVRLFPADRAQPSVAGAYAGAGASDLGRSDLFRGFSEAYDRLMLHAESLGLHHPGTKAWVEFRAECPF